MLTQNVDRAQSIYIHFVHIYLLSKLNTKSCIICFFDFANKTNRNTHTYKAMSKYSGKIKKVCKTIYLVNVVFQWETCVYICHQTTRFTVFIISTYMPGDGNVCRKIKVYLSTLNII